jgi:hypothetical protein
MGEAPEWFVLMKVAKWLGVAPWDLARQPVGWYRMAALAIAYESQRANTPSH